MATAIIDLEFESLPGSISVQERYQQAEILLRYRGCPVARFSLPVANGAVLWETLESAMVSTAGDAFWRRWLVERFDLEKSPRSEELPSATIATCTRDRPEDLRACLVALLRLPDDGQEILIVDNHPSTSATREIVAGCPRARYVLEERPGLDAARNRALREARGDIVAFIDDDALADPNWLRALRGNFTDPRVLCVTGLTMPAELETEAQELFEHYSGFSRGFERRKFSRDNINPLMASRVGAGANMAVRRSLIDCVGPFDEALDAGTPTQSGGDTEMFSRILRKGYRIVYEPAALNWHRHRRTREELRKVLFGYGVGVYATFTRKLLYDGEPGVLKLAASWFWNTQLPGLLRSFLKRKGSLPVDLLLSELRGCAAGPGAYLRSKKWLEAAR